MTLDEIQALCDAATPGPWRADGSALFMSCGACWTVWSTPYNADATTFRQERDNAAFIAAARTLMPRLVAVARAAVAHLDPQVPLRDGKRELIDALAALEAP